MPRPRLTLGRLMAWIAFAALNLWILGTAYRRSGSTYRGRGVVEAAFGLVLIYLLTTLAFFQIRSLYRAGHDPTRDEPPSGCALFLIAVPLIYLVYGLVSALMRG